MSPGEAAGIPGTSEILLRDHDAYLCGGLGRIPCIFISRAPEPDRFAGPGLQDLHHHSGAAAMERFRVPVKEKWPYAVAFASGYLLHFLLDARCHPYVNQVAGRGIYTHFALEGEYDRYLLRKDGTDYASALPKKEMPPEFYALAARMADPVTPAIYQKALADFRWVSLKFGAWAGKPVRHVVNAASHIPPARPIRGMILGSQPDVKLERYMLTLDRLCASAAETAAVELARAVLWRGGTGYAVFGSTGPGFFRQSGGTRWYILKINSALAAASASGAAPWGYLCRRKDAADSSPAEVHPVYALRGGLPGKAIRFEELETAAVYPPMPEEPLEQLIRTRRSIRHYSAKLPPKELIQRALDTANYAPSRKNQQVYTVVWGRAAGSGFAGSLPAAV